MYAGLDRKICTRCKATKILTEFHKNKNRLDGFSAWCKTCKSAADAKGYSKSSDKIKKATKGWKLQNPERKRELNREYKKRNPEKVNINTRKYKQKNRGVTNANTAKRLATLLQRTPPWLSRQHLEHIKLFYKAAAAMTKEVNIEFHVDHIIPLQGENVSGLHVPWNLQVITATENVAKKNRFKI